MKRIISFSINLFLSLSEQAAPFARKSQGLALSGRKFGAGHDMPVKPDEQELASLTNGVIPF